MQILKEQEVEEIQKKENNRIDGQGGLPCNVIFIYIYISK